MSRRKIHPKVIHCILAKHFHAFLSGLLLKCIVKNKGLYILVYVNLLSMRKCMESEII